MVDGPLSIQTCSYETLVRELGDPFTGRQVERKFRPSPVPRRKPTPAPRGADGRFVKDPRRG